MDSEFKKCSKCLLPKFVNEFGRMKSSKDGLRSVCKLCKKIQDASWATKNKERRAFTNHRWYKNNVERHAKASRGVYVRNRQKIIDNGVTRRRLRLQTDIGFRISNNLRARLNRAVKGITKTGSAIDDLGCTQADLLKYLESKFEPWMSWDNYGKNNKLKSKDYWVLDHIVPISRFDLTNREEFLRANHYTNLQPMHWLANLKKSDK